jgi:hypothetical protein
MAPAEVNVEMTAPNNTIEARLSRLEARNRRQTVLTGMLLMILGTAALAAWSQSRPTSEPLRVRGLIVEDEYGRPRIVIGSPIADRNASGNPRTG